MKTQHDGDCSIYASLDNVGVPEAGICTCGYGHQLMRTGDYSQVYSGELLKKLEAENKGKTIGLEEFAKMMENGGLKRKRI